MNWIIAASWKSAAPISARSPALARRFPELSLDGSELDFRQKSIVYGASGFADSPWPGRSGATMR